MRILFLCIMTFIISIDCIGKNIYDEPCLLIEANLVDFRDDKFEKALIWRTLCFEFFSIKPFQQ